MHKYKITGNTYNHKESIKQLSRLKKHWLFNYEDKSWEIDLSDNELSKKWEKEVKGLCEKNGLILSKTYHEAKNHYYAKHHRSMKQYATEGEFFDHFHKEEGATHKFG